MRYWRRIAPKALRWENMTPVYEHITYIWTLLVDACRICSWRPGYCRGGQELTISLYKPIIFCRGGTLIFALTAGDRREIHSLFRISGVIWCYNMLYVVQFGLNSQTKIVPMPTRETGVLTLLRPCNSRWNGLQDKDMQRGQGWPWYFQTWPGKPPLSFESSSGLGLGFLTDGCSEAEGFGETKLHRALYDHSCQMHGTSAGHEGNRLNPPHTISGYL